MGQIGRSFKGCRRNVPLRAAVAADVPILYASRDRQMAKAAIKAWANRKKWSDTRARNAPTATPKTLEVAAQITANIETCKT